MNFTFKLFWHLKDYLNFNCRLGLDLYLNYNTSINKRLSIGLKKLMMSIIEYSIVASMNNIFSTNKDSFYC